MSNINTKLLQSVPCASRITKNHTRISQGTLDLGPYFHHVILGGISSFLLTLLIFFFLPARASVTSVSVLT